MSGRDEGGAGDEGRETLVAEYVLGLLSRTEQARVERLIADSAALRRERDFWIARLEGLNDDYAEIPVPAHIYGAIEARVFGGPARPARLSLWESLRVWRGLAAGATIVAVAALASLFLQPAPDVKSLTTQLVAALENEGGTVTFVALHEGGASIRLVALSGEAVPDRDFELWAIQGAHAPISLGVIPVARSRVTLTPEILAGWGEGSVLAITLEPEGGSPSGAPTGPIVAKGAVTEI